MATCPHCNGHPKNTVRVCHGGGKSQLLRLVCHYCNGEGTVSQERRAEYLAAHDEEALLAKAVEKGLITE